MTDATRHDHLYGARSHIEIRAFGGNRWAGAGVVAGVG